MHSSLFVKLYSKPLKQGHFSEHEHRECAHDADCEQEHHRNEESLLSRHAKEFCVLALFARSDRFCFWILVKVILFLFVKG